MTNHALAGSGIREDAGVRQAVLSGERQLCDGRDTVEAVGERSWCDGPRGGRGPQRLGTTLRCDGRCCRGRNGGVTDDRGGCSGVFVFYLHMGMGKIHLREEGDPIMNRIKDRVIFLCKRYFFSTSRSGLRLFGTWTDRQSAQYYYTHIIIAMFVHM